MAIRAAAAPVDDASRHVQSHHRLHPRRRARRRRWACGPRSTGSAHARTRRGRRPQAVKLFDQPRELPSFSLQQSDGTQLVPGELKGHWTLVFLGFTHCPDVCPTTLAQLAAGAEAVGRRPPRRQSSARAVRVGRPGTRHA